MKPAPPGLLRPDLLVPDLLIIGAGPAGLTAALTAAEGGARVLVADLNPGPGGQIWRGAARHSPGEAGALLRRVHAQPGIEALYGAELSFVEEVTGLGRVAQFSTSQGPRRVLARQVILATGASERFVPFPGWTLPGVVGAGGLQAMVKGGLKIRGARVVVAGSGPLLLAVAAGLRRHGARVLAVAEQAKVRQLAAFALAARNSGKAGEAARLAWNLRGAAYLPGTLPVRAEGTGRLERAVLRGAGMSLSLRCDWLAVGFGLVPDTRAAALFGCALEGTGAVQVNAWQATTAPGVYAAGEMTGVGGAEQARLEGFVAACAATGQVTRLRATGEAGRQARTFQAALHRSFALRPEVRALPDDSTVVCRCEDVTHAALNACHSWTEAKLHTRIGMGTCQGRVCGPACETLYGWSFGGVRPPLTPLPISDLLGDPADPSAPFSARPPRSNHDQKR